MPARAIARNARTAATVLVRAEGRVMVVVCFVLLVEFGLCVRRVRCVMSGYFSCNRILCWTQSHRAPILDVSTSYLHTDRSEDHDPRRASTTAVRYSHSE